MNVQIRSASDSSVDIAGVTLYLIRDCSHLEISSMGLKLIGRRSKTSRRSLKVSFKS